MENLGEALNHSVLDLKATTPVKKTTWKSWVIGGLLVLFGWHFIVVYIMSDALSVPAGQSHSTVSINPFVNHIAVTLDTRAMGIDKSLVGAALAVPMGERMIANSANNMARQFVDVYALVLPYRVTVSLQ